MPKLSPAEVRELLARDLPGALVPMTMRGDHTPAAPQHGKPAADMLATNDSVVQPEQISAVARYLRDQLGYELLTNLTAVDYLLEGMIELVYHFSDLSSGVLAIKTRVPRAAPRVPSLTPLWPGADFQEREAYDLYGVVFDNHPNLRRIYMWDEFEGFPMRKDFVKQGDKYFGETG